MTTPHYMRLPDDEVFAQAARQREQEAARRKAETEAAGRKMTEEARQRARVDALITWAEEMIWELNYNGRGSLTADQLGFPDPFPTAERKPRTKRADRNAAAALAFLENEK
ncbi:hypothetical protein ABZ478_32135 [Streptomyces sp. NPDC005706]|uniref:hypothetical protein n=1 Tax=Streptomyces sp. NPDC005706 TaxID=3157169 RepID=UPI003403F74C